jgi:hypothetical protein
MQMLDAGSEKERATIERLLSERLAERENEPRKAAKDDDGVADTAADGVPAPESRPAPESDPEPSEKPKSEPARTPKAVEGEGV